MANCQNTLRWRILLQDVWERERNVLFNDALNTFYLRLYGVRHMVKDHSDSEKGNPLPPYRLTARVLLYAPSHRQDNTYHGLCYTSRGALAGTRNSSMGPPHEGSIRRLIAPWANALPLSYVPHPQDVWMRQVSMTDAGTTQDNFILPAPPVGGLPMSQDWLHRTK